MATAISAADIHAAASRLREATIYAHNHPGSTVRLVEDIAADLDRLAADAAEASPEAVALADPEAPAPADEMVARGIAPLAICGVMSNSGPNGEPLACAYQPGHQTDHSWATLPTFVEGRLADENWGRRAEAPAPEGQADATASAGHAVDGKATEEPPATEPKAAKKPK